jgi:hypothetical protein
VSDRETNKIHLVWGGQKILMVMKIASNVIFGIGLAAYLIACRFIGSGTAEIFSDVGNAFCIVAVYLRICVSGINAVSETNCRK